MNSVNTTARDGEHVGVDGGVKDGVVDGEVPGPGEGVIPGRTIRFHDEQQKVKVADE
jgi:hypothetical protein